MNDSSERFDDPELEFDRRGTELRSRAFPTLTSSIPVPVRSTHRSPWVLQDIGAKRVSAPASAPPSESGEALLSRASEQDRLQFRTLVLMESAFGEGHDYALLIAPASTLVERQLNERVVEPARGVAGSLLDVLRDGSKDDRRRATILEDWAEGRKPTMLGTMSIVLQALRRGLERGTEPIRRHLLDRYLPSFVDRLGANGFGHALDTFRERYRNPACHGLSPFDSVGYRDFSYVSVGNVRLAEWEARGLADATRLNEGAIFHQLLACERFPPPPRPLAPSPTEELVELTRPRGGRGKVDLEPTRVPESGFRLGESVGFRVSSDESLWLTLIDLGTSGAVTLLLPNGESPAIRLQPNRPTTFPDDTNPGLELELTGKPGTERLIAVGTRKQPPKWAEYGEGFACPRPDELNAFVRWIQGLPPDDWSSSMICLEIL